MRPRSTKSERTCSGEGARALLRKRSPRTGRVAWLLCLLPLLSGGCVSKGDFLRLEEQVADLRASESAAPDPFSRIAELSADVDALRDEVRDLQGELELARKESADALEAARQTRSALAQDDGEGAEVEGEAGYAEDEGAETEVETGVDLELAAYQAALDAWRDDDFGGCIDGFTSFLQSWPESGRADDAAYWLADCTYKNGEFKRAVVRFNAVVTVYPNSPKAPDALYRQGESLLKLGPKFHEAARTVFKTVQRDYPESERATEAAEQLERLGSGTRPAGT